MPPNNILDKTFQKDDLITLSVVDFLVTIATRRTRIYQLLKIWEQPMLLYNLQAKGRKCWTYTYIGYSFFHLRVIERHRPFSFRSIDLMLSIKKPWHDRKSQSVLLFQLIEFNLQFRLSLKQNQIQVSNYYGIRKLKKKKILRFSFSLWFSPVIYRRDVELFKFRKLRRPAYSILS